MRELREGEFLEVKTLRSFFVLDDADYIEWLDKQKNHSYMLERDDPNYEDSSTYYDRYRRLLNVVSHRKSLIHYYGCREEKKKVPRL